MLKAIKIRLYPTETQQITINKLLGCCRLVYNKCLEHRNKIYEETKESGSLSKSYKYFCELKEMEEYSFLKTDSHSKVIQQSLRDQDVAFKNFFIKKSDFPKFKSKKDNEQKCRFPNDAISGIKGNMINIINTLKNIHFKCSRKDERYLNKNQVLIVSGTLTKTCSGKYYFSIFYRTIDTEKLVEMCENVLFENGELRLSLKEIASESVKAMLQAMLPDKIMIFRRDDLHKLLGSHRVKNY